MATAVDDCMVRLFDPRLAHSLLAVSRDWNNNAVSLSRSDNDEHPGRGIDPLVSSKARPSCRVDVCRFQPCFI